MIDKFAYTRGYKNFLEGGHAELSNPYSMGEPENKFNWLDGYKAAQKLVLSADDSETMRIDALAATNAAWNKNMTIDEYNKYCDDLDNLLYSEKWER